MANPICTQPHCLLKADDVDEVLPQLVLAALEGRSASDQLCEDFRPIELRDTCLECLHRVMDGRGAYLTVEERESVVDATNWSRRRDHRRRVRENRT